MLIYNKPGMLKKLWNSSTITTWFSYSTAGLNWLVVLPLLLNKFTAPEIAVWMMFKIIIDSKFVADIGFSATFIREIAYAFGGAASLDQTIQGRPSPPNGGPNWDLLQSVSQTMAAVYNRLALGALAALLLLSPLFIRPISQVEQPEKAWIAWGIIILSFALGIRGYGYTSLLQGMNQIPLYRRWDTFMWLVVILASFILLVSGAGLLELVIVNQSYVVLAFFRNRLLAKKVIGAHFHLNFFGRIDPPIFSATWSRTWRSGLGVLMSYGLTQGSGMVYAQIGATENIAAYLLALRFAQNIAMFSGAPFYSKLPLLASLYAQGNKAAIVDTSSRSMRLSHWIFLAGIIIIGLFLPPLLLVTGSNAEFVSPLFWLLIGASYFTERFGAMHLQLYSTSNHIIWHVANGVTALIAVLTVWALYGLIGIYAFPLGYLVSNLGFYSWYSAKHSYREFQLDLTNFERKTSLAPLASFLAFATVSLLLPLNLWLNTFIVDLVSRLF